MSDMYNRIEKLCRENGIRIAELCQACGISHSRISDLKTGRVRGLSRMNTNRIADYFGVTSDYLTTGQKDGLVKIDTTKDVINTGPLVRMLDNDHLLALISACTEEMKRRAENANGNPEE